jgi:uncharacterized protein YdhG (YjbR/CyaY superfamily)
MNVKWRTYSKGNREALPAVINRGGAAFKHQLEPYKTSKGAIQFPLGHPIPFRLVKQIVEFRLDENARTKVHS